MRNKYFRILLIVLGLSLLLPLFSFEVNRRTIDGQQTEVIRIGPDFAPVIEITISPSGTTYNFSWGTVSFGLVSIASFITAAKIGKASDKEKA
jgi:hypothetical protein